VTVLEYSDIRNPQLPWGYWLHQDGGHPLLVDDEGRRWSSVREAFWVARLGMRSESLAFMDSELERLTAVLAAMDRRRVPIAEAAHDIFAGERRFEQFYRLWLHGVGLTAGHGSFGGGLSDEGGAALIMLAATRPSRVRYVGVGLEAISTMTPRDASDPETSAWLDRVDAAAARLQFRFVRHELWRKPSIALVGDGLGGEVPIRRTIWTQTFSDHGSRDGFLVWLAERLDRWETWGLMAYERGAPQLTQHLLATFAASGGVGRQPGGGRSRLL